MKQCIINGIIHTGDEVLYEKNIIIDNGLIQTITGEKPAGITYIDLGGMNVAAGFIDIQINGGEKFYFTVCRLHVRHSHV